MSKSLIPTTVLQIFLRDSGDYRGRIDGHFGVKTMAACREWIAYHATSDMRYSRSWSDYRVRTAVEQAILSASGCYRGLVDGRTNAATYAAATTRNGGSGAGAFVVTAFGAVTAAMLVTLFVA